MKHDYVYGIRCWDKYPNITTSIETITPQVAIAMLACNDGNRKIKSKETITEAIENGDWCVNGDTIRFSDEGELIDGQHRLMACIKANIPITSLVVRGIPKSAQITMDAGSRRTVNDFLKMKGYKDCWKIASIGNALLRADRSSISTMLKDRTTKPIPTKVIVDFIDENYETRIKPLISKCNKVNSKIKGVYLSTTAPIFEKFKEIDLESYEHFVGMLTGEYVPTKTMLQLLNKLNANAKSTKEKFTQEYIGALIIKTWNAYITGTELNNLRYQPGGAHPESFPDISCGMYKAA